MGIQLPECVNTEEKQRKLAEEIAARYRTRKAVSSKLIPLQGTASVTLEVALGSGDAVIIQFRTEPLDISTFAAARRLLGDGAPSIETVEHELLSAEHVFCVLMTKMPGGPWMTIEHRWEEAGFLTAAKSLGRFLSRCFTPDETDSVEAFVLPRLEDILTVKIRSGVDVSGYFPLVEKLIVVSGRLKELPGFFSHPDLNPMNIFLDESGNTQGIVDWEGSRILPFGLCGWAIHFLAGQFLTLDDGSIGFVERPIFEPMERVFWQTLIESAPQGISNDLKGRMEIVQLAVITGTVLRILGFSEVEGPGETGRYEDFGVHLPSVNILPKLLRYRLPMIRGPKDKPFSAQGELDGVLDSLL